MNLVTPKQMKVLESIADSNAVSYEQLMLNAGNRLAVEIKKHTKSNDNIVFLCGNGNNAGDCFVASNILIQDSSLNIYIAMLCGDPKTELSKKMFNTLSTRINVLYDLNIIKSSIESAQVLCDGIFGTGFHGEIPKNIQEVLSVDTKAYKIAVDVPSGVNCTTGQVSNGTLKFHETITFAYTKLGMILYPANTYCGKIITVDIGITQEHYTSSLDNVISLLDIDSLKLPMRSNLGNKGTFGRVLHITGSKNMMGACIMASKSALRCGVGLVTICTENNPLLPLTMPEPIYINRTKEEISKALEKSTGALIGCGLGTNIESIEIFKYVVDIAKCPLIIDADGINILSNCIDIINNKRVILTPHPLEMSRLVKISVEEVQSNRMEIATKFAKEHNCIVILKGAGTIITDGKQSFVDTTANSGMSKGGSGDVLAGIVSSFVAQGMDLLEACKLSVYIHSASGLECSKHLTPYSMLPTDVINEIPNIIKSIISK